MKKVLCVLGMVALSSCGKGTEGPVPERETPMAVATTTIVADLVRQVAGDDVEVISLMGPGVDPHLYKPSAGDVRRMAAADVVFYNGLHLEGKMGEVLERFDGRGIRTIAVAECVSRDALISSSDAGTYDPHVWFDVGLWRTAIPCVREGLATLVPSSADTFGERAEAYSKKLEALDAEVGGLLAAIPPQRRVLVTAHDAFAYFGRAYGLEVRGLLGVSTASEAGAADVQELADFIERRELPAVFVETSVSPRSMQALREAVAARGREISEGGSLYSDALGSPDGPAADYVGTVRTNVEVIVGALAGGE